MADDLWNERVAAKYDENSARMFSPEVLDPTVDFLADLAGDGRALEFAIGTGRVAVPLANTGVPLSGIDSSAAMIGQMTGKPGAEAIDAVVGDMTTTTVEGPFSLVYLVFNTIGNVQTQEAQVAVFRNAARHLEAGGHFVVEVGVPDLQRLPPGETARPFLVTEQRWGFDEYDLVSQSATSHHFINRDGSLEYFACPYRYVWPAELDLMAQLAGMNLKERWADWNRNPFTAESPGHVSVWEKPVS
ncbi:MAG: methyltransferase domain-containing protein [Acidimicrobiia bacterium]|nr:methyltransferase domain-containing protein [Acidimicrobiia bacterium]